MVASKGEVTTGVYPFFHIYRSHPDQVYRAEMALRLTGANDLIFL